MSRCRTSLTGRHRQRRHRTSRKYGELAIRRVPSNKVTAVSLPSRYVTVEFITSDTVGRDRSPCSQLDLGTCTGKFHPIAVTRERQAAIQISDADRGSFWASGRRLQTHRLSDQNIGDALSSASIPEGGDRAPFRLTAQDF